MEQTGSDSTVLWIFLFITLLPLFFAWLSRRKRKKMEITLQETLDQTDVCKAELEVANSTINNLEEKYSSIIDADEFVARLIDETEESVASKKYEAETILAQADSSAKEVMLRAHNTAKETMKLAHDRAKKAVVDAETEANNLSLESKNNSKKANEKLAKAREQSTAIIETAHKESTNIIKLAKVEAMQIAGDAYEAKEKADSYESTARAMRNTIEGYRDEYIVPNHSVLDDLAEDYSFSEAGNELKTVRKRIKDMVKNGHAGDCNYVENHRKTYAINFIVDAFNGKTDSALSKVKHDNFGKVRQEIDDAFALVNHNGEPFRNARIKKEYLNTRQEELKWAVATHELRQKELAEQREIKQQIREEEKARREMEKAIKEAEKEEKLIQTALNKARQELASASEEQRLKFAQQLEELEGKLADAEARGERALSMAQQTRRGHVYVISNIGSFGENVFKIGMTRRLEPMDRVKELGDASVPFSFDVHAMLYSEDAPTLEKELHKRFEYDSVNKVNFRKEFFRTTLAEIKQAVQQQNLTEVHWTMKAEAAEYRESLAIESKLKTENVA
jgi:chromosome segregation ATPase